MVKNLKYVLEFLEGDEKDNIAVVSKETITRGNLKLSNINTKN